MFKPQYCGLSLPCAQCQVGCCFLQDTYYENTKASRFTRAGFSAATVNLALAYNAAERGDEAQVRGMQKALVSAWVCKHAMNKIVIQREGGKATAAYRMRTAASFFECCVLHIAPCVYKPGCFL